MSAPTKTVVIIDDDRTIQATLAAILERQGYAIHGGATASLGLKKVETEKPDLVLLDLGLPDAEGLDVLRKLKADFPALPVLILTANDTLANAIEAIKLGAFHFLSKPYAAAELVRHCELALEQRDLVRKTETLAAANVALEKRLRAAEDRLAPVSVSRKMREIEQLIARIAGSEANVLLTGESGVGKEVYAGELHRQSARAAGPMIKLNCGALPANMIEAELFGYARGAFTGAIAAFSGMLAEARGGTLFLDEVTEMPLELQTRFLRVLQDREFRPLGTTTNVSADFRLIAACNRPVAQAVREGRLRPDLYYRLKTFEIEIPPLRERLEDLAWLLETFLRRFAQQLRKPVPRVEPEALEMLRVYRWPGNVRELQNAAEHALVLCDGPVLGVGCLPREVRIPASPVASGMLASGSMAAAEKAAVLAALRRTGGNKKQAADILGIHRPTLYVKMRRFGIGT